MIATGSRVQTALGAWEGLRVPRPVPFPPWATRSPLPEVTAPTATSPKAVAAALVENLIKATRVSARREAPAAWAAVAAPTAWGAAQAEFPLHCSAGRAGSRWRSASSSQETVDPAAMAVTADRAAKGAKVPRAV